MAEAESYTSWALADARAEQLLNAMGLDQKIGQLVQIEGAYGSLPESLREAVASGAVGSIINEVDPATISELQRSARAESPHGIPLLIGRDVIHGFHTIFPIPLGIAATWSETLIERAAGMSAREATQQGVHWTFSPMHDATRDPRWGRIAESFGEDPLLTARFGAAMVRGYQKDAGHRLVSCLKHFVGYGACEAGKDYNTTNLPEIELRNVYLPPFEAALRAGALTVMPSFSDLNGMPPSGNAWLLREVLRDEWGFGGLVVSDWASIAQLVVHGVAEDEADAAAQSALAGVNMDMVSGAYAAHLTRLVETGIVSEHVVDALVLEVLRVKFSAGLFDAPAGVCHVATQTPQALALAQEVAEQSIVLLKNDDGVLPLAAEARVCLLGPLADQPYEQLGTWVFDGDVDRSVTIREAFAEKFGERLSYDPVLETSRDRSHAGFDAAETLARQSDVVVLALGEEAILSGEAHCRSDIQLPGVQAALVGRIAALGKPVVVVILAGRPLAIPDVAEHANALLYAWHPGSMAGPALLNVLTGGVDASGRLPVTLPRQVGQVPIYYAHGHTGKPATPETVIHIDDIDPKAPQTSIGNTSFHLDVDPSPLFPFGFGLSYTTFEFDNLREDAVVGDEVVAVAVDVRNRGERDGVAVAQLYVRDLVASATRPVRELKAYERLSLAAGEQRTLRFALDREALSFHNGRARVFEPGRFRIWVGEHADAGLSLEVLAS